MAGTVEQVLRNIAYTIDPEKAKLPPRNTTPYTHDSCYGAVAHYLKNNPEWNQHWMIMFFGIHPSDVTHCILANHSHIVVDTFQSAGGHLINDEGGLFYVAPNTGLGKKHETFIPLILSKTLRWFREGYFNMELGMAIKSISTTSKKKEVKADMLTENDTSLLEPTVKKTDDEVHQLILQWFSDHENANDPEVHDLASRLGLSAEEFEAHIYNLFSKSLRKIKELTGSVELPSDNSMLPVAAKVEKASAPCPAENTE